MMIKYFDNVTETMFSEEKVVPGLVIIFSIIYFAIAVVYYNEER